MTKLADDLGIQEAGFAKPLMMGGRNWRGLNTMLATVAAVAIVRYAWSALRSQVGSAGNELFNPYG